MAALSERNPDLFKKGDLRDLAVRSAAMDERTLSEMIALHAAMPTNGPTPGARLLSVLEPRLIAAHMVQLVGERSAHASSGTPS